MRVLIPIIFLVALTACRLDQDKLVDRKKFTFRTGDDTELFFKNVRQLYYNIQEIPQAGRTAFRLKERNQDNQKPRLYSTIVINWLDDEAYILIETNELLDDEETLAIRESNTTLKIKYSYELSSRGRENMLEFATKVYEGLVAGHAFEISLNGSYIPLFDNEQDRDVFRKEMSDYYRLTRVF